MTSNLKHHARKRFGQHFLIDENVVAHIIAEVNPKPSDHVVEIGPGLGVLTAPLLAIVGNMQVVELDRDIIPKLAKRCSQIGKLTIHSADALKFDYCQLVNTPDKLRVVGNLPYNISTPLIFKLLEQMHCIEDMHFMLQKEVVDRMVAPPGCGDYGRLSVMTQYHCLMEKILDVPASAFEPPPKVESAVIRLSPHAVPPVTVDDLVKFGKTVAQAFSQRRKTLRNNFKKVIDDEQWALTGIDPSRRAETLSLNEFVLIDRQVTSTC
jgi:16S rRNA (adenine1518-N6/adenine1519-N6)-dimethyltransferase